MLTEITYRRSQDITIGKSCNEGTCQDGKCNLISDRWGIIVQAVEGAVRKIVYPSIVVKELPPGPITVEKLGEQQIFSCIQDSLRQKVLQNLVKGLKIECLNTIECAHPEKLKQRYYPAASACVDLDTPGIIWLTKINMDGKAATIAASKTFMGSTPPSGEEAFEGTLFHEILHGMGGVKSHLTVSACEKACYGFSSEAPKEFFDKTGPQFCK
jgi:hypothetical protein